MSENFTKLVESFYGSTVGNIQSPVWLCGLEWGGGYDPETPILESELEPYGMEDLQATSLQDFIDSFLGKVRHRRQQWISPNSECVSHFVRKPQRSREELGQI